MPKPKIIRDKDLPATTKLKKIIKRVTGGKRTKPKYTEPTEKVRKKKPDKRMTAKELQERNKKIAAKKEPTPTPKPKETKKKKETKKEGAMTDEDWEAEAKVSFGKDPKTGKAKKPESLPEGFPYHKEDKKEAKKDAPATTGDVGAANFVYSDVKEAKKQKQ
jgi:hypothetical protein